MSIAVEGVLAPSVVWNPEQYTTFSAAFLALLPSGPARQHLSVTLNTPVAGTFTVSIWPRIVEDGPSVSLGSDWATFVRELMLASGFGVAPNFDPFAAFLAPGVCAFFI